MEFIKEIKDKYLKQSYSTFLVYGNTSDLYMDKKEELVTLRDFLVSELFGSRELILFFNPGSGIKFGNDETRTKFLQLIKGYDALQGTSYFNQLPASYGEIMKLLDRFIRIQAKQSSLALIIEYTQLIYPNSELSDLDNSDITGVTTILEWAKSLEIANQNTTICLVTEQLSDINVLLQRSEFIPKINIGELPVTERKSIISKYTNQYQVKLPSTQKALATLTNGFTTQGLIKLLQSHQKQELDLDTIRNYKKELIESRTGGLVELVETDRDLSQVAGHVKAKQRLSDDAKLLKAGKTEAMPMGYLLAGPVGTGKSFIAECFAGEIGIPAIKLKNFREKWVGATESNWERILTTIKSLAPILVIVDEADAALGNREQDGDSGTQQRVFAKLAETMGDTHYRGRIIWMLLTSRPELIPVDLKRQGRAEVHIPLLYPDNNEEKIEMFKALSKKIGFDVTNSMDEIKSADLTQVRSGADTESVLIKAKRFVDLNGKLNPGQMSDIIANFRSSIDESVIAHQTAMALAEVTDKDLI